MHERIRLTAHEAVERLRKGEVSPLELIDAAAERILEVEKKVNALPTLCLDRARDRARKLMAGTPGDPPLHFLYGLPIAVKDLDDVEGVRTTYGSPIFSDHVPERSNIMVEILEANGAVVIGKSNTPEFGAGANTFNEVFGATLNPWHTAKTCGGSSGGSAVALATGEVWLATGSDLGGSLRTPAGFCSIVGFRPTPGRIATGPSPLPFDTLPVVGPMGRNVADVALMMDAQVGQHPLDPLSLPRPATPYTEILRRPHKPERIGFTPDLGIAHVHSEIKEICTKAAVSWADLGVSVDEACPDFTDAHAVFHTLRAALFVNRFAPLLKEHRRLLKPEIIWNIEKGLALTLDEIGRAERRRAEIYHDAIKFFDNYDLLICPSAISPPFDVNLRYLTEIEGHAFDNYMDWLVVTFATTLIACPSISIPCGFTRSGLPVGLQIIGPPRCEDQVLSAAFLFEQHRGLDKLVPIDPRQAASPGT